MIRPLIPADDGSGRPRDECGEVLIAHHDANLVAAVGIFGVRMIQRFRQLLVEQQALKAN